MIQGIADCKRTWTPQELLKGWANCFDCCHGN